MPRINFKPADKTPVFINTLVTDKNEEVLLFATRNQNKLAEFERILGKKVDGIDLKVDEIQSLDPIEVASKKAISAWEKNGYSPIIVEDTSLSIPSLNGFPGTYVVDFTKSLSDREKICQMCDGFSDRSAVAMVVLAIYDGVEVQTITGQIDGRIANRPIGSGGFGWDDIFIPKSEESTFAQMSDIQKDKYSMRKLALSKLKKDPFKLNTGIVQLYEPFKEEIDRIRIKELSPTGVDFAFKIESLEKCKVNKNLDAPIYLPIHQEQNTFYERFSANPNSPSLGLVLTNIDYSRIQVSPNGQPILYQMGPERRKLALAQRAHYFDENQNDNIHKIISILETQNNILPRSNHKIYTVEKVLSLKTATPAISELGYKKISSTKILSRRKTTSFGLFNKIGKYPRKIIGLGSMPPTTGWRDTIVTAAIGHMVSFIPRNSVFAGNIKRQINLALEAQKVIRSLNIDKDWQNIALRNIGASLGTDNPQEEVKNAKILFEKANIKLFRIYTINADLRVIETARLLRKTFGKEIEIFVGQIADINQASELIKPDIMADALVFGHGGGRQCTSAINGMGITTLEDIYEVVQDPRFNKTSIILEGGIDRSIGTALILGADCVLYNQKLVHGTIETGDLFVQDKSLNICSPYPGSASPVTQIIESENPSLRLKRTNAAGRTVNPEGKPGFMYYDEKACTMAFWVNELLGYAGRTLADLGMENISELREFLKNGDKNILRILSEKTQYISDAYRNNK